MSSHFIYSEEHQGFSDTGKAIGKGASIGATVGTAIPIPGVGTGAGAAVGAGIGWLTSLGKKESKADKSKQQIQAQLKRMGYPQFAKMKGWKGNEKNKEQAMQTILTAVNQYPEAVSAITGWLEGGKVTPATINRVKSRFPAKSSQPASPAPQGNQKSPAMLQPAVSPALSAEGNGHKQTINPLYLYAGGLLFLGIGAYALTN